MKATNESHHHRSDAPHLKEGPQDTSAYNFTVENGENFYSAFTPMPADPTHGRAIAANTGYFQVNANASRALDGGPPNFGNVQYSNAGVGYNFNIDRHGMVAITVDFGQHGFAASQHDLGGGPGWAACAWTVELHEGDCDGRIIANSDTKYLYSVPGQDKIPQDQDDDPVPMQLFVSAGNLNWGPYGVVLRVQVIAAAPYAGSGGSAVIDGTITNINLDYEDEN